MAGRDARAHTDSAGTPTCPPLPWRTISGMKRISRVVLSLFLFSIFSFAAPRTMRIDYYHGGNSNDEWFTLDRTVLEPLEWPGNPAKAIDESGLGNYMFEVREQAKRQASLFARIQFRVCGVENDRRGAACQPHVFRVVALSEPRGSGGRDCSKSATRKIQAPVSTRSGRQPSIQKINLWIGRGRHRRGRSFTLQKMGDSATKVDLLVLGDGYTAKERGKFEADARRFMEMLFAASPFKEHRQDFNVWGLCPPAEESGVSRPSSGIYHRSPLGASYDTFDSERYVLTTENRTMRDVASFAPYEFVEILVNAKTYGGGGIFNQYATVAIDNGVVDLCGRARIRASLRRAGGRVLHLRCFLSFQGKAARAMGAECDGAARSGEFEVEGSGRAGNAFADAVA